MKNSLKNLLIRSMFFLTLISFTLASTGCATIGTGTATSPQVFHQKTLCVPGALCRTTATETISGVAKNVDMHDGTVAGVPVNDLASHPGTHTKGELVFETPQGNVGFEYQVHDVPEPKGWCDNWVCPTLITIGGVLAGGVILGAMLGSGDNDVNITRTTHTQ